MSVLEPGTAQHTRITIHSYVYTRERSHLARHRLTARHHPALATYHVTHVQPTIIANSFKSLNVVFVKPNCLRSYKEFQNELVNVQRAKVAFSNLFEVCGQQALYGQWPRALRLTVCLSSKN